MIDRNWNLFLIWRRRLLVRLRPFAETSPVRLRLVEQRDVIRSGGLEAVPHLPRLRVRDPGVRGEVRWGRRRGRAAAAGSFVSAAVSAEGPAAGRAQAAAPAPPGAAGAPLMPAPRGGGSGLGRGRAPPGSRPEPPARRRRCGGGGGRAGRPDASPPRPPAGRRRPRSRRA